MKAGDIVNMKRIRIYFEGGETRGSIDYSPPNGAYFVFLLLGHEPIDRKHPRLDVEKRLRDFGWVPVRGNKNPIKSETLPIAELEREILSDPKKSPKKRRKAKR